MTNAMKYKSAKERAEAFDLYCKNQTELCSSEYSCTLCKFLWLDLEAEDEKPLPCPFCVSECDVDVNFGGLWIVGCSNNECLYLSPSYNNKSDAIVAHNRVARAVMAAKEKEAK